MGRDIERWKIFLNTKDRNDFIARLVQLADERSIKDRRVFSLLAVKELGYSGATVARYLGVTNSCVTRAVLAEEAPEKENYICGSMHALHERPVLWKTGEGEGP